jgi:hypothetical protein
MKDNGIKILFGLIIFLFGVSLAYFGASYVRTNGIFDYWGTIAIFTGLYALIGILVSVVFPISLGFLFAADVLLIHLLAEYFGEWAGLLKFFIVGAILIVLYTTAWIKLKDKEVVVPTP